MVPIEKLFWRPIQPWKVMGRPSHISNLLLEFPVEITQLARGITTGSVLEFTNKEILADAINGRRRF